MNAKRKLVDAAVLAYMAMDKEGRTKAEKISNLLTRMANTTPDENLAGWIAKPADLTDDVDVGAIGVCRRISQRGVFLYPSSTSTFTNKATRTASDWRVRIHAAQREYIKAEVEKALDTKIYPVMLPAIEIMSQETKVWLIEAGYSYKANADGQLYICVKKKVMEEARKKRKEAEAAKE